MHPHEAVVLYLGLHQSSLIIFSIWHLYYYCSTEDYNFGIGGFFIGFPIHSMIFMSWYMLRYSPNFFFWLFALFVGGAGWLLSWCFMVSLDHWTLMIFLVLGLVIPIFVAALYIKQKRRERIELTRKKNQ